MILTSKVIAIDHDNTVPAGYDSERELKVVMDILLFKGRTAEESIALSQEEIANALNGELWQQFFRVFIAEIVPLIRASGQQRAARSLVEEVQDSPANFIGGDGIHRHFSKGSNFVRNPW
jgi:hypothetical protein